MLWMSLGEAIGYAQEERQLSWLERVTQTRSSQPDWVTPTMTASANLEDAPIYDVSRKSLPIGNPLVTSGGPRGIQFVPIGKLQLTFGATPYFGHNDPKLRDGFGDTSFAFKYRLLSGNQNHGNFALSAQMGATIATGSYQNGAKSNTFVPNLLAEKAWTRFDIQSTFGASLPTSDTHMVGRQFISNTAFQGRLGRKFWPEFEVNSTSFHEGANTGKNQVFLTPGLLVGRFPVTRSMGFTFGAGMQIAATHYHTYDHNLLFTVRLPLQSQRRD